MMVYKSLNGLAPDYLKSMFTDQSAISNYSLTNCEGKLAVPLPRTGVESQMRNWGHTWATLGRFAQDRTRWRTEVVNGLCSNRS